MPRRLSSEKSWLWQWQSSTDRDREERRGEEPRRPRDWTRLESLCYDTPSQMSTTKTRGERGRARARADARARAGRHQLKEKSFPFQPKHLAGSVKCGAIRDATRRHHNLSLFLCASLKPQSGSDLAEMAIRNFERTASFDL